MKFVSHSHCQQLLASLWYEGLPGFRRRNSVIKVLIIAIVGLLGPLLSIAYLLMPRSRIGRIMRQPFIKFICHSVSYIFFLSMWKFFVFVNFLFFFLFLSVLLFVVSLRIEFGDLLTGTEQESNERRGPPPNPVELAASYSFIFLYIIQNFNL